MTMNAIAKCIYLRRFKQHKRTSQPTDSQQCAVHLAQANSKTEIETEFAFYGNPLIQRLEMKKPSTEYVISKYVGQWRMDLGKRSHNICGRH